MNQENYQEAMINANAAFSNKNYALALEWFRKALEENPDDLQALSRAGAVCVPLNKYDESFEYFQRAMELEPENGDHAFNMGNAYFFRGDYKKALELYAEAELKGCSEEAKQKLYYQMALLCSIKRDIKSALANFKKYEEMDKTGLTALNPDVISEKIKLYMMAEDYENATKYAVQWIAVDPTELRSYMVYFSILMARHVYDKAEQILNDAEKYAEVDDEARFKLKAERVLLLVAKADADTTNAKTYLQNAFSLIYSIKEKAPAQQKNELTLILAEVCMKMERYQEAIETASSLLPNEQKQKFHISHHEVSHEELNENEIEAMAAEDMQVIDEKIASGEIDESIGEYADVYYDEDGNPVRDYPDGVFDDLSKDTAQIRQPKVHEVKKPVKNLKADYYDRLYFILLSCYVTVEDYENAHKFGGLLKHSENAYYSYFGRYTEAFSMRKLSESSSVFSKKVVDEKYAETIAFYRNKMLQNSNNNFAVIFRARMYAEMGKFAKAEEMASLLTLDEKKAVMEYINACRKEYQNM